MRKFVIAGSFALGAWLGWYLGYQANIWVALVAGVLGGGLGLFLCRRYLGEYL